MALRLLGFRVHSEVELGRKLQRRGYEEDEIASVVARFVRLGYLDDGAYAANLVARRSSTRGAPAIAAELRAKGVRRSDAEAALAPVDRDAEIEAATGLVARFARGRDTDGTAGDHLAVIRARLQRRGFSGPVVREACRRYLGTARAAD